MKRRLTLAFGCLACAVPSVTSAAAAHLRPASQAAMVEGRRLSLLGATQVAQGELERRGLAGGHSIASVVLLRGVTPDAGHFDVRIDPPAMIADGQRLRGFAVAMDGGISAVTGFRAALGQDAHATPAPEAVTFSGPATNAGGPDAPLSTP